MTVLDLIRTGLEIYAGLNTGTKKKKRFGMEQLKNKMWFQPLICGECKH
jgi:hypothetical protein